MIRKSYCQRCNMHESYKGTWIQVMRGVKEFKRVHNHKKGFWNRIKSYIAYLTDWG